MANYPTVEHVQKVTAFKAPSYARGAIETLKWLEDGAPHKFDGLKGDFVFNMGDFISSKYTWDEDTDKRTSCGTACCIAGAVYSFSKRLDGSKKHMKYPSDLDRLFKTNRDTFDKTQFNDLTKLFYVVKPNGRQYCDLKGVTPAQAAVALRKYLEEGVVDWSHLDSKV